MSPTCICDWAPISTAPKDGTKILAFDAGDIYITGWVKVPERGGIIAEGWIDEANCSDFGTAFLQPSHWTSLPNDPEGYIRNTYEAPYSI